MVCTTRYCRSESLLMLQEQLPILDSTDGLMRGAVAIAAHSFDDVDLGCIDSYLNSLSERVRGPGRSSSSRAKLARLHHVLFEEEGFRGNRRRYYHPLNSFLPAVIESRQGLPITLSLIYKVVGDRAGLEIEGVNSPGHFLIRVRDHDGWMLIDPFDGGKATSQEEAFAIIERCTGARSEPANSESWGEFSRTMLPKATHRQWLSRMVLNLQQLYFSAGCWADMAAMNELQGVLGGPQLNHRLL